MTLTAWRDAREDDVAEVKARIAAGRAARAAAFSQRMDETREAVGDEQIEVPPVELDGWDLLMRGDRDLLGAVVRRRPDPDAPHLERPKGHVVYFDDEGVRIMVFGRPYGKLRVLSEDVIPFSEVDPAETAPGSHVARHRVARMLLATIAEAGDGSRGRREVTEYERRLIGFASRLSAPDVPARRSH